MLLTVVVLTTVCVCVTVGVGSFNVLVKLTHTVCTGSVVTDLIVLVTSFCTVCVVPGGVKVDLSVVLASSLIVCVETGRVDVRVKIRREVVVLRIVCAGSVVLVVLIKVLVLRS